MTQKFRIWGIAVVLFAGIAGFFYPKQPPVQLIAQGNVSIYDLLESAAKREGKIILVAKKGRSLFGKWGCDRFWDVGRAIAFGVWEGDRFWGVGGRSLFGMWGAIAFWK